MEQHTATPRTIGSRTAAQAYQQAAWRSPGEARFDRRPANDWTSHVQASTQVDDEASEGVPRWLVVLAGAIVASLLAVFAANAMAL